MQNSGMADLRKDFFTDTIFKNPYIPQEPTLRQAEFLLLVDEEAFFGGAAGGGKSSSLLMAALQFVQIPEYHAILFRKTYSDLALPDALMDRSFNWLSGTDAHWDDKEKTWTFPSGATLSFGYLKGPQDKYRYQGAAFSFIGVDEVTQIRESDYLYLYSRLRKPASSSLPLRMRAAGNPGGVGHQWVKERFITGGLPYIPSKLQDNPYLDQETYRKSLMNLDPITREQLLNGDWDICVEGNLFKREWFPIVPSYPSDAQKIRYWDFAATEGGGDWTAGALLGYKDDVVYIIDIQHFQGSPKQVEARVLQTAQLDGTDVPVYWEEEGGSSGKVVSAHFVSKLMGWQAKGIRSTGSKVARASPLSSYAEAGNVKIVRGEWNRAFLDEITLFPVGEHDDMCDAVSGAFSQLSISRRSPYEATLDEAISGDSAIPDMGWDSEDIPGMW